MARKDGLGALLDGVRPLSGTNGLSSLAVQRSAQAPSLESYSGSSLLLNGHGGLQGGDAYGQHLHEARALSPTPCRGRLSGSMQYGLPATSSQAYALPFAGSGTSPLAEAYASPPYVEGVPRPLVPAGQITIALDVDEVLCRYVDGFRKWLQRERPAGPLDEDSVFREAHDPHSPWRLQFAMCGGLDNLEAVPGAVPALRRLRAAGLRLEVVTSRPPIMRESTEALLDRLFPPDTFAAAHFVGGGEKGRTCNAIKAVALVDDQIPNIIDAHACGVISVLFNFSGSYPWAVCTPEELPAGVMRLETWAATSEYILSALRLNGGGPTFGEARGISPVPDFRRQAAGELRARSPAAPEARRQLGGGEMRARSPVATEARRQMAGFRGASSPAVAQEVGRRFAGILHDASDPLPQPPLRSLTAAAVQPGSLEASKFQWSQLQPEERLSAFTFEDRAPPARAVQVWPQGDNGYQYAPEQREYGGGNAPAWPQGHGGMQGGVPDSRRTKWANALQGPGMMQRGEPMFHVGTVEGGVDDTQASCTIS